MNLNLYPCLNERGGEGHSNEPFIINFRQEHAEKSLVPCDGLGFEIFTRILHLVPVRTGTVRNAHREKSRFARSLTTGSGSRMIVQNVCKKTASHGTRLFHACSWRKLMIKGSFECPSPPLSFGHEYKSIAL
jgi:hypothetical protein